MREELQRLGLWIASNKCTRDERERPILLREIFELKVGTILYRMHTIDMPKEDVQAHLVERPNFFTVHEETAKGYADRSQRIRGHYITAHVRRNLQLACVASFPVAQHVKLIESRSFPQILSDPRITGDEIGVQRWHVVEAIKTIRGFNNIDGFYDNGGDDILIINVEQSLEIRVSDP